MTHIEWFYKFYKPERLRKDWQGYEDALVKSHCDDLEKCGYDIISRHDSVTGKAEYFFKKIVNS